MGMRWQGHISNCFVGSGRKGASKQEREAVTDAVWGCVRGQEGGMGIGGSSAWKWG